MAVLFYADLVSFPLLRFVHDAGTLGTRVSKSRLHFVMIHFFMRRGIALDEFLFVQ